jgi:hypothetical protein
MSTCLICDTLPLKDLRLLDVAVQQGTETLATLAVQFKVDRDALAVHAKSCVDLTQVNGFNQLVEANRQLTTLISSLQEDIGGKQYITTDEEGNSTANALVRDFLAAQRELRENVTTMRRMQSTDDAVQGITRNIVGPMVSSCTAVCIEEMRRLRDSLFTLADQHQHIRIKESIDTTLERIAARIKTETMQDLREKVEATLQAKPQGK